MIQNLRMEAGTQKTQEIFGTSLVVQGLRINLATQASPSQASAIHEP